MICKLFGHKVSEKAVEKQGDWSRCVRCGKQLFSINIIFQEDDVDVVKKSKPLDRLFGLWYNLFRGKK